MPPCLLLAARMKSAGWTNQEPGKHSATTSEYNHHPPDIGKWSTTSKIVLVDSPHVLVFSILHQG